ncbi:hypothetical protein K2173_019432 [Erythroxylum novogranatense]|uniref:TIP41-like protein n=1 Tax=Erythroxylum novogranatense TaxID=1862640 RepID=A0AAV8UBF7_9ROSI|nr:hypothetical protein K2173_019432 [Erythroxylum novogranatense]
MEDSLNDGEFWLPPQFLSDEETVMGGGGGGGNGAKVFGGGLEVEYGRPLFPFEVPYGFGKGSSDLSSPVASVVGSTETESDEEDFLAGLTRQMVHSTLDDDFARRERCFATEHSKGWVVSGSPQSTLCAAGSGCGCRRGSSLGSPNGPSQVASPPATWDLLYAAAGEVARMRVNEERFGLNSQNRGLLSIPRTRSPVSVPANNQNQNQELGLYLQQSLSDYHKLQATQFQRLRQQQILKQQNCGVWGGQQAKGTGLYQPQPPVPNIRGRCNTGTRQPMSLSANAWPTLQQQQQGGSCMRAVFLGNNGGKRESTGTGVFLPRRVGTQTESTRKKTSCSTVLLPARVVQALNLNLDDMGAQPQLQPRFNGGLTSDCDIALTLHGGNANAVSHQKRSFRPHQGMNTEVRLPQEWTY